MADQSNPFVYTPTRGDRRVARQVLADLGCDESSPALSHLAAGPLGRVVRFMAGSGLVFTFVGREGAKYFSIAGPTADAVIRLIRRLLNDGPSDPPAGRVSTTVTDQTFVAAADVNRLLWVEAAVELVIDCLHERDLEFVLGWQLPGESRARLDCAPGTSREVIEARLNGFLIERLGVSDSADNQSRPYKEVTHA